MPTQAQDHFFNSLLAGRPSKKHRQDTNSLGITHLCCKFGGIAAEQHAEAVAWQSQLDIQWIISAASSIYIRTPIAHFAKKCAQITSFTRLALPATNVGNHDILFTLTQKQGNKEPAQFKDPGDEFFFKFEEAQRAAFYDPINCSFKNINKLFMNISDTRGGCKFDGQLGISRQVSVFFVII
jgi:hypothetical protein